MHAHVDELIDGRTLLPGDALTSGQFLLKNVLIFSPLEVIFKIVSAKSVGF